MKKTALNNRSAAFRLKPIIQNQPLTTLFLTQSLVTYFSPQKGQFIIEPSWFKKTTKNQQIAFEQCLTTAKNHQLPICFHFKKQISDLLITSYLKNSRLLK